MKSSNSTSITEARANLYRLVESVQHGEPVHIEGKRGAAVLISADDWRSIQETLYLLSIPGMRESLLQAAKAPDSDFSDDPGW